MRVGALRSLARLTLTGVLAPLLGVLVFAACTPTTAPPSPLAVEQANGFLQAFFAGRFQMAATYWMAEPEPVMGVNLRGDLAVLRAYGRRAHQPLGHVRWTVQCGRAELATYPVAGRNAACIVTFNVPWLSTLVLQYHQPVGPHHHTFDPFEFQTWMQQYGASPPTYPPV